MSDDPAATPPGGNRWAHAARAATRGTATSPKTQPSKGKRAKDDQDKGKGGKGK